VSHSYHAPRLVLPVGPRDHIRGPEGAPVTLVEYGDYQCPFCGAAHPVVNELLEIQANTVRFVFRHFPISTIHPLAEPAAEAAEAAAAQGKFWPMHDWIYDHQDALTPTDLLAAAARLGLDVETFAADVSGHRHEKKIREDFLSGVRSGVNGTTSSRSSMRSEHPRRRRSGRSGRRAASAQR